MKNSTDELNEDLRPEYDLSQLVVRRTGPDRSVSDKRLVRLAPDVSEMFPTDESVNEALRFLIRAINQEETDQAPMTD